MSWHIKATEGEGPEPLNNIDELYHCGLGVSRNIYTTIGLYTRAAEKEEIDASYHLGELYETEEEMKDQRKTLNIIKRLPILVTKKQRQK
jgi:TPR repeat protein